MRNSQGWEAGTPEWVSVVLQGISLHGHRGLHGETQADIQLEQPYLPCERDASSDYTPPKRGMVGIAWPVRCLGV